MKDYPSRTKVYFMLHGQKESTVLPENKGVIDIAGGFWVDAKGEYSAGTGRDMHWIPPSQILVASKVF